jgi:putative phosphoesterase
VTAVFEARDNEMTSYAKGRTMPMRVAIISDIHDNVWSLSAVLEAISDADALICCGDLCSPFIVHQLGRGFQNPIHIVFGNNDGDLFRITANAAKYSHIKLHGHLFHGRFAGKSFAVNHYDNIGRSIARSGEVDVVCFGHNHVFEVTRIGETLAVNPGAIMGASFSGDGERIDSVSTFVVYDTDTDTASGYQVVVSALGTYEAVRYPQ